MRNGLIIDELGTKRWFRNDLYHREDGPAVIGDNGVRMWYIDGERHRLDGPALIWPGNGNTWYLHGRKLTFNQWLKNHPTMTKDEKIIFKLTWG